MAFLVDTQELKPGLIIFRRTDVKHRNCTAGSGSPSRIATRRFPSKRLTSTPPRSEPSTGTPTYASASSTRCRSSIGPSIRLPRTISTFKSNAQTPYKSAQSAGRAPSPSFAPNLTASSSRLALLKHPSREVTSRELGARSHTPDRDHTTDP